MERHYATPEEAEKLAQSLAPDQGEFVRWERAGTRLTFVVEAESPRRVRATVEDLLACLGTAERTLGVTAASR
ncbi:MAG: hypothetical protein L3J96_05820 [Thermoplasmata archaeon]|nr:hypothetical protein [Thermoplasmata archaeon]